MIFNKSIDEIIEDSNNLCLDPRFKSDSLSYFEFVKFFKDKDVINKSDFILAVYFSYGWMPRIPTLNITEPDDIETCVEYLRLAKVGNLLNIEQLTHLKRVVNNSIVGVSKILHFTNPSKYLIWDKRVANYFNIREVNSIVNYNEYSKSCRNFPEKPLKLIQKNVAEKDSSFLSATPQRALEFVFFSCGKKKNV